MAGQYIRLDVSSPFPVIQRIESLRNAVSHKEEIRFMDQLGFTTVSYVVSCPDTFDSAYARECRGIVFDKHGKIVARPLHKFFNVNEKPTTQEAELPWASVARVMDKRDGSMIHTVRVADDHWTSLFAQVHGFDIKSKKSFVSDVANSARAYLTDSANLNVVDLCKHVVAADATAIFEYTSPRARIVLSYPKEELKLLHVRDNETGRYLSLDELTELSERYGVPLCDNVPLVPPMYAQADGFLKAAKDDAVEGIEGWVFQFENGDMVKLKTKWYMDRHRAMTFLRVRDIAHMVIEEALDDLKSKLVGDGIDIAEIEGIERRVVEDIREIEVELDGLFATTAGKDRKTVALENKGHKYFGLLMQKFSGKEPDVAEYFRKNLLDDRYDLTQLNLTDSVAEVE